MRNTHGGIHRKISALVVVHPSRVSKAVPVMRMRGKISISKAAERNNERRKQLMNRVAFVSITAMMHRSGAVAPDCVSNDGHRVLLIVCTNCSTGYWLIGKLVD